jgi:hypothetical protein
MLKAARGGLIRALDVSRLDEGLKLQSYIETLLLTHSFDSQCYQPERFNSRMRRSLVFSISFLSVPLIAG